MNRFREAHELTFSVYHGYPFLLADRTRLWLSDAISQSRIELNYFLWSYVFMPEHVHMIVWPRDDRYDIADIRQAIKEPVGRAAIRHVKENSPEWLARLTRRRGSRVEHLFWQSGGGYDRNIRSAKALLAMIKYHHLNPVRRQLVERAVDWKWSSAAW